MIADIFRKKVDSESKVTREIDETSTLGQASMRIIAKNTLTFKAISRDLRSLNGAFSNYVKLHKIKPAEGAKLSDLKKELSSHDDMKTARVSVVKVRREKPKTFMASLLDKTLKLLFAVFVGTLLSIGYVVYKVTEIISPYVSKLIDAISNGITIVGDAFLTVFKETNFFVLLLKVFKKTLGFLEESGIVDEKSVDSILGEAGSVYKTIIRGIGSFIKDAVEWLAPKLRSIGSYVATDILGVDLKKITERRAIKDILVAESKRLENEYAELDKKETSLAKKSHDLTEEIKAKQNDLTKAKEEEDKKKAEEESKKKQGFFDKLFKKEEKKKEEVKPEVVPEKKKEEVKPAPLPEAKKPAPKVDVTKIPADDGSKKSGPAPEKPTTSEKKKEESKDGSGDAGMKYTDGSNVIKIISKYGMRQLPDEKAPRLHGGIDYAAALATPITFKGREGKVVLAQFVNGYGRVIDLSVEKEILRFAHLSKMLVKPNDIVKKDDTIGLVGGSGGQGAVDDSAFGPHLHFEHRSKSSFGKANNKDTIDPVKSGAVSLISFGNKIAATDYSISEKYASYKGEYGEGLNAESSKLALAYREQSKPNNPTYVDARTRNNNVAQTNTNHIPAKA